jgi:hypothetical protein
MRVRTFEISADDDVYMCIESSGCKSRSLMRALGFYDKQSLLTMYYKNRLDFERTVVLRFQ